MHADKCAHEYAKHVAQAEKWKSLALIFPT